MQHLEKVKKKDVVSLIGDSFFQPVEENGVNFYLRRTNLQRVDGRTLDIVDEIEVEEEKSRVQFEEEEAKDMTYEAFMEQFKTHIEGTAANEREAHDSADENADPAPKSISKKGSQMDKKSSHHVMGDESID